MKVNLRLLKALLRLSKENVMNSLKRRGVSTAGCEVQDYCMKGLKGVILRKQPAGCTLSHLLHG